ncbi:hypothetical protein BZG36_05045 [Bifiguratus adelaidae]|uniref:Uncharacterized protein n=1 Tax=Bifiguratus adelaidae TaxID=1938954 RepID=A0A261XU56_9FUNG|nr:hypothetical protein BZG36_05045 [Bifiguratus adelaidae]
MKVESDSPFSQTTILSLAMPLPSIVYPAYGATYLVQNWRTLSAPIMRALYRSLIAGVASLIPIFGLVVRPQARAIEQFFASSLPRLAKRTLLGIQLSTWSSVFLGFGESAALVTLLVGETVRTLPKQLFDRVIRESGVSIEKVSPETPTDVAKIKEDPFRLSNHALMVLNALNPASSPSSSLTSIITKPALYVLTLPLTIIPFVGAAAFVYVNGSAKAGTVHRRYFDQKKMSKEQRRAWLSQHYNDYRNFGMVAVALESIPLVGILFRCTNSIGAALWAINLEKDQQQKHR